MSLLSQELPEFNAVVTKNNLQKFRHGVNSALHLTLSEFLVAFVVVAWNRYIGSKLYTEMQRTWKDQL